MRIFTLFFTLALVFGFVSCHADVNTSKAEIIVIQSMAEIPNKTGSYDFDSVQINMIGSPVRFIIVNNGLADLELTAPEKIEIAGADASQFVVNTEMTDVVLSPGDNTTFYLYFKPDSVGQKAATITIPNNSAISPYTFAIVGTALQPDPEIIVKVDNNEIANSTGSYNFGNEYVGYSGDAVLFVIRNQGAVTLNLTGTPLIDITGPDSSDFIVDTSSTMTSVISGGNNTFKITFAPTSAGNKSATVSIENNDSDENPYTFTINGLGVTPQPEINVKQDTQNIPNSTGEYDFGKVTTGFSSANITFTIENVGLADLMLTGSEIVAISGANASEFKLSTNSTTTPIAPSDETKFKIQFSPTSAGSKEAMVTIENNDTDENPYTFEIVGTGSDYLRGDFNGDGYQDILVGAYTSDEGSLNSGCAFVFFGRQSWNSTIDAAYANVKLVGASIGDAFGYSVASAGDVNDDGIADIMVSAVDGDSGGTNSGTVYLFFGKQNWTSSVNAADADVIIAGESPFDRFGCSSSGIGDVNADGIDDIIVGAYLHDGNASDSGTSFVFFGRQSWTKNIDASTANVKIFGDSAGDAMGFSVSYAGDVNHDGKDDLIVGASQDDDGGSQSGCAFIFFGRQSWNATYLASTASVKLIGEATFDRFGCSVSYAGNLNNNGFDDVIVGAWGADGGGSESGGAYIFFGRSSWASTIDASAASVKIIGADAGDYLGTCLSFAGDVNSDGYDDLIVGAAADDDGGTDSGCAFLFLGRSSWTSTHDASLADTIFVGADTKDSFGYDVSTGGDLNNDGYDDVVVGAIHDDDGTTDSGCVFIFRGRQSWTSVIDASAASTKLVGKENFDSFGYSISGN